jgi:hypothetical protein
MLITGIIFSVLGVRNNSIWKGEVHTSILGPDRTQQQPKIRIIE